MTTGGGGTGVGGICSINFGAMTTGSGGSSTTTGSGIGCSDDGFLFDFAVAVRNSPRIDFEILEHPPHVLVAGEHEKLMALLGEVAKHGARSLGAAGIEVDEHVVEDHRQMDAATGVRGDERQPQADE